MMSNTKVVLLVAVALTIAVSVANCSSLIVGRRVPGDALACYGNVDLPARYNSIVSAERYCNLAPGESITYIYAQDRGYAGRGGYAEVIRGGLNQNTVSLYLWSQRSQPLNFSITVYSKRHWFSSRSMLTVAKPNVTEAQFEN